MLAVSVQANLAD